MSHYAYLAHCADDSYYAGYTTDLARRIKEHNSNTAQTAKYTRARQPVKLGYFESFSSRSEAMKREYELKQLKHEEKERLAKEFDACDKMGVK